MGLVILLVLIILVVGGMPALNLHSYGYGPSGVLGLVLVIVLILFLLGRL